MFHGDHDIDVLDKALEACPMLNSVQLDHGFTVNGAFDLSSIHSRPGIHTFKGKSFKLTDNSARYLMHKFPKLMTFTLTLESRATTLSQQVLTDLFTDLTIATSTVVYTGSARIFTLFFTEFKFQWWV